MTETPYTLRWGIISTGTIATVVTKDLLFDPQTRGVNDVKHQIVAVASRSIENAQKFIDEVCVGDKSIKAYGSYEEIWKDQNVDAIYIGTPHTHHYVPALAAMSHGKHLLCEKPVTSNSAELSSLIEAAKKNNVFFMEAMWTRFQPLFVELNDFLLNRDEGTDGLGKPLLLNADLSGDFDIENLPKTHRILDPYLGGGGLLDLGPYPLVWALTFLFAHPKNAKAFPSHISSSMQKTPLTGVDANTSFTLQFESIPAQAVLQTNINLKSLPAPTPCVTIRFQKGVVEIGGNTYRPTSFTIKYLDRKGRVEKEVKRAFNDFGEAHAGGLGGGWHWQADEVARCIRDGKTQSDKWGWDMSVAEMKIFDEVRKQGGYYFPPGVEQVV